MITEPFIEHAPLWHRLQAVLENKRVPQAFLFIGLRHAQSLSLVNRLIACLICENGSTIPCGYCKPCHLFSKHSHPDVLYVSPDANASVIKIDQVRELQQTVYQTPQCGERRFIVINPADKLNHAAFNALLKILEEPPSHTTFILIAEQIANVPATIKSRCQHYTIPAPSLETAYANDDSPRGLLFKQQRTFRLALEDVMHGRMSVCAQAMQWSKYDLSDVLWLLYWLTAQMITQGINFAFQTGDLKQVMQLFYQLDKINVFMRNLQNNINLNQTLTLETLLLGYIL